MSNVLVSVICTNYNKGSWIGEAIESFLNQKTNFTFEILLIDDKSTDESRDIIKEYAKKYPSNIRAFYNKENLGITKTWIKICKEAKGKYIARCDGDDYWIDNQKLQKQVDVLEVNDDSKWCTTDYDIVTPEGKTTHQSAVETGFFDRPNSYAEMLATKGMTMASTWLVDTQLMRDINNKLNEAAIDDTFNIQMDLFNRTKLTYLPKSMAAYRMNEGSDSKPIDDNIAHKRDERLLETQLEYINKYKNVSYEDIVKILLRRDIISEDRFRLIRRQRQHIEAQERIVSDKDKMIRLQNETIQLRDKQISDILNSKKYKVGESIIRPISIAKSVLKRRKH
jgi:glucosyltransferase